MCALGHVWTAPWQELSDVSAEVERVEPNENIGDVEFGMEALAALAASGPDALRDSLRHLPTHYEAWIAVQEATIAGIAGAPRQATAQRGSDAI